MLKAVSKIRNLFSSCILIQHAINIDLTVLDDLIGVNKLLQLCNGKISIFQYSLLEESNVQIAQQLILIHMLDDKIGADVLILQQSLCVNVGFQSGNLLDQLGKLCSFNICKQSRNINILHERIQPDRLNDLLNVEDLEPCVARDDLKQLGNRERFLQSVNVNRYACLQILQKCGRDPILLQNRRKGRRIQRKSYGGSSTFGLGIEIHPSISKSTEGQCSHYGDQREHQGKKLVELLHNKTSLLCFRFRPLSG